MAKQFATIDDKLRAFIGGQQVFFVATAAAVGRINMSPRPTDCLRVIGPNSVAYRDLTGSGSETAAHLRVDGRMTMLFCAFDGAPLILRLYGRAVSFPAGTAAFKDVLAKDFDGQSPPGTRQIVLLEIDLVQTSCGYGVPLFDFVGNRDNLKRWTEHKGEQGLRAYRQEKNRFSLDGWPSLEIEQA
ncbi:Pyridoxamine 5'-phosphate oxidase, putative [Rhabdaerophilaceae bacterium]